MAGGTGGGIYTGSTLFRLASTLATKSSRRIVAASRVAISGSGLACVGCSAGRCSVGRSVGIGISYVGGFYGGSIERATNSGLAGSVVLVFSAALGIENTWPGGRCFHRRGQGSVRLLNLSFRHFKPCLLAHKRALGGLQMVEIRGYPCPISLTTGECQAFRRQQHRFRRPLW